MLHFFLQLFTVFYPGKCILYSEKRIGWNPNINRYLLLIWFVAMWLTLCYSWCSHRMWWILYLLRWCDMFFWIHGVVDPQRKKRRTGSLAVRDLTDQRWPPTNTRNINAKCKLNISFFPHKSVLPLWVTWTFSCLPVDSHCTKTQITSFLEPVTLDARCSIRFATLLQYFLVCLHRFWHLQPSFISDTSLVLIQHGYHVLVLNLKRINRFRSRSPRLIMKCPVVSVLQCREQIQCDPEFIQVRMSSQSYLNHFSQRFWLGLCLSLGDQRSSLCHLGKWGTDCIL